MRSKIVAALLFIAMSPAVVQAAYVPHDRQAELRDLIDGRVRGKSSTCILLRDIRSTRIIEDTAIVYETWGSSIYVNRPGRGARGLKPTDTIVSRTPYGRLCEIDAVDLVDRSSHIPTGFVLLGQFIRYDRP